MIMEAGVTVQTLITAEPLFFSGNSALLVEDLCIACAKSCGIGPLARHLFGLWDPEVQVWLSLCKELKISNGQRLLLCFKLRFKPPSVQRIIGMSDQVALNYYFKQMKADFLSGTIPELLEHKNRALGLAATDMIREVLEGRNLEELKSCYRDFLPSRIYKKHHVFLRQPLMEAVEKGLANCKQNVEYVKGQFITEIHTLVPEYGNEQYSAQIDEGGRVSQVLLQIDPYHIEQPGLRIKENGSKGKWAHICSIADLYNASIRKDGTDMTVEVCRSNGIPKYFTFKSINTMHSFVSCLDGYYRLMEKWTFDLCAELPTPSLLELRLLKCHGPIGYQFSCAKLKDKKYNKPGSYIIRQSSCYYEEFQVDYINSDKSISTIHIEQDDENQFRVKDEEVKFSSFRELLNYISSHPSYEPLTQCVPPSEYDKAQMLLCRMDDQRAISDVASECSCTSKCIPSQSVIYHKGHEVIGKFTVSCPGELRRGSGDLTPVMIKSLCSDAQVQHMQEFLKQCSQVLQWKEKELVSTLGMILFNPTALVMEYLPLGRLDEYLRYKHESIKPVDLAEASRCLGRALWYLEEQGYVHGKIRCRNVLVANHTDKEFKVKLGDPGLLVYSSEDIPWIPPECRMDTSLAASSLAADIWAFGTTLWELFSFGMPAHSLDFQMYGDSDEVPLLEHATECQSEVKTLIAECRKFDPDSRKRPQTAFRDLNQMFYEVYNSRRSNSYATVMIQPQVPPKVPAVPPRHVTHAHEQPVSIIRSHSRFIRSAKQKVMPKNTDIKYNNLSTSSTSSEQSVLTVLTDTGSFQAENGVSVGSLVSFGSRNSISDEPPGGDISNEEWVLDISQLSIGAALGQGFYGKVCKAVLSKYHDLQQENVAVKTINNSVRSDTVLKDLEREINIMKNLTHKNIVEIKGFVEVPELMLVMEFVELGSLLSYLLTYKHKLETCLLLKFATDIAQGMQYLEMQSIVHRDLASRNILVASHDLVKISDFGLAQITGENHYYKVRTERNLPVRWYAPESIMYGKFSHKSDVWSYGVTLWEMFSFGENPTLPGVSDKEMAKALVVGQRLTCPKNCSSDIYRLMGSCWQFDSHDRPSFQDILDKLSLLNYD